VRPSTRSRRTNERTEPRGPGWLAWVGFLPILGFALFADLWAPDEPRYAQVSREAWERGDFLVLHLAGEVYPDKPPLVFWLAGLCGRLAGWSGFALRIPTLLATLGSAWLARGLARRFWGELEASWVPFFYLSTAFLLHVGGRLQLDPALGFLCLASLSLVTNETLGERQRALGGGLALGLATLVKGPVAWLHVLLPILGWRWILGRKEASDAHIPARAWIAFAVAAILPAALWACAAAIADPALARDLFWGQHAGRVMEGRQHAEPPWFYLAMLVPLYLPWTFVCAESLARALADWKGARRGGAADVGLLRAAVWFLVVLAVFSLIPVKRNLYLLPVVPALALLVARAVARAQRSEALRAWVVGSSACTLGVVGVLASIALLFTGFARGRVDDAALEIVEHIGWKIPAFGLVLCVAALAALRSRAEPRGFALRLGLGFSLACGIYTTGWVPEINPIKSARGVAEFLGARAERPREIPCIGFQPEGYRFYGRIPATRAEGFSDLERVLELEGQDFLALVDGKRWERMTEEERRHFRVLLDRPLGGKRALVLGGAGP